MVGALSLVSLLAACGHGTPAARPTITVTITAQPSASPAATAMPVPSRHRRSDHGRRTGQCSTRRPARSAATLVRRAVDGDEISVSPAGVRVLRGPHAAARTRSSRCRSRAAARVRSPPGRCPRSARTARRWPTRSSRASGPAAPEHGQPCPAVRPRHPVAQHRRRDRPCRRCRPARPRATLPAPISHLSWAADGSQLAVSVAAFQDNEGWNLVLVDPGVARDYLHRARHERRAGHRAGRTQRSYIREGASYLPDGDLFVSRACCGGVPMQNTSRLMWEVGTGRRARAPGRDRVRQPGTTPASPPRQMAAGCSTWPGTTCTSRRTAKTPSRLATGLIAATWM